MIIRFCFHFWCDTWYNKVDSVLNWKCHKIWFFLIFMNWIEFGVALEHNLNFNSLIDPIQVFWDSCVYCWISFCCARYSTKSWDSSCIPIRKIAIDIVGHQCSSWITLAFGQKWKKKGIVLNQSGCWLVVPLKQSCHQLLFLCIGLKKMKKIKAFQTLTKYLCLNNNLKIGQNFIQLRDQ